MKTIQEVIRGMDPEEIEKAYFHDYPDSLSDLGLDFDDLTVREAKKQLSVQFQDFLQSLLKITLKPDYSHRGILFLSKMMGDCGLAEEDLFLVHADEVLNAEKLDKTNVPSYAFELTPRSEAMSFLVADNKLTQDWLMTVVTKFLYEMSFFGYDEDGAIEEVEELDRRTKDAKEHPEHLVAVDLDEMWEKSGLPKEEVYPEEKDLRDSAIHAVMGFADYCRMVELERIRSYLREHIDEVYPEGETIEVSLDEACPMGGLMTDISGLLQALEEDKNKRTEE